MLELLAGVAVAIAALAVVLEPVARPAPPASPVDDDDEVPLEESASPKVQALLALKEIEFDRATGKLSDVDYDGLKTQYTGMALAAMRGEEAARGAPAPAATRAPAAPVSATPSSPWSV